MQDKFNQFYTLHNGTSVEVEDPTNRDQCMDLAFAWCDYLSIPREAIRHERAYEVFTQPSDVTKQYFSIIPNSAEFVPQIGDLGIFGTIIGPSGHIVICVGEGDTTAFVSFDQNWDTAHDHLTNPQGGILPYCHKVKHTYNGFLGVLRPIQKTAFEEIPVTAQIQGTFYNGYNLADPESMKVAVDAVVRLQKGELVDKAQFDAQTEAAISCQTQLKSANDQASSLQDKIKDITDKYNDIKSKYDAESAKNVDLNKANATISGENQDNAQKALDAEHVADSRKDFVNAIADELNINRHDITDDKQLVEECLNEIVALQKSEGEQHSIKVVSDIINHLNDTFGMNEYLKANNLPVIESLDDPAIADKVKKYLTIVLQEIEKNPAAAEAVIKKNPNFLVNIGRYIASKLFV